MPALQVREFPDELYDRLRAYAAKNHRSIAQQTVACVESDLLRQKAHDDAVRVDDAEIEIPPNVREASARARFVNPWATTALDVEPQGVINARRERLMKVKEEAVKINWKGPAQEPIDIVRMVREERESRASHVIERVAGSIDSDKGGAR